MRVAGMIVDFYHFIIDSNENERALLSPMGLYFSFVP